MSRTRAAVGNSVLLVVVSVVAAAVAHGFRAAIFSVVKQWSGGASPGVAARALPHWKLGLAVFLSVVVASGLAHFAQTGQVGAPQAEQPNTQRARGSHHHDHHHVHDHEDDFEHRHDHLGPRPVATDPGPTLLRGLGTFIASAGLASLGREAAIIDFGGLVGRLGTRLQNSSLRNSSRPQPDERLGASATTEPTASNVEDGGGPEDLGVDDHRHDDRPAPWLSSAGTGAAFAAAYNSPVAAVMHVQTHLGKRPPRTTVLAVVVAAAIGELVRRVLSGSEDIFPSYQGPLLDVVSMGAISVVPATLGSIAFIRLRARSVGSSFPTRRRTIVLALVAALLAVVARDVAGNGMEAIRSTAGTTTITLIIVLAVAKMLATSAVLGAGARGGVFSPAMAVAVGWALLTCRGLTNLGVDLPGSTWAAVVAALSVGVAVGVGHPWVAVFVVPEMIGDYRLVAPVAAVVGMAVLARRGFELVERAANIAIASRKSPRVVARSL